MGFSTKTVACKFTVDNHLHQIYLDGVNKNGDVAGHRSDWTKQKTISFPSSTKSMAIFATDYEQGCRNGGMAMKCYTPVKSSKWNMDTSHTNAFKQKRKMKNCANPHSPGPSVKREDASQE